MGPETLLKSIRNNWENWPLHLGIFGAWNQEWTLPTLQAHRGYHLESIPENSMESLAAAKANKYEMAEIDVQLTKDGIPIVFHDFNLRHRFLINVNISQLDYSDLLKINYFPTLNEVLTTKDRPEFLNIEIKSKNLMRFSLEDSVAALIEKTGYQEKVLISSFNPWSLMRFRFLNSRLTRALLVTDQSEVWNVYYLKKMWLVPLVEPHVLNIRYSMFNPTLALKLKNLNVLTSAWTVNDLDMAKSLISLGVSSIISDTLRPESLT